MSIALTVIALCAQVPRVADPLPRVAKHSSLIENLGQWDTPARFAGEIGGTLVRVEPDAIWLYRPSGQDAEPGVLLKLSFEGASGLATVEGLGPTPTLHSYFIGNDPEKWVHAARAWEQVRIVDVYPGIDVVLGERNGVLKYDVCLAPGADLGQFVIRCEGADAVCTEQTGSMRIEAGAVPLLHALGEAWEESSDGSRRTVHPRWRMLDGGRFGVSLEARDSRASLVIDPELSWAGYLGSSGSFEGALAADAAPDGTVVVVGAADHMSFPTTPGSVVIAPPGEDYVFVTKLSANGNSLVYSCLIGGSVGVNTNGDDLPHCVQLDTLGRAYVAGETGSLDFPTTLGAFDRQLDGFQDGFALRLSPNGDVLEYSTFVGGASGSDVILSCVLAPSGAAVLVGVSATDFPTTPNAFQLVLSGILDVVVARLSPDGSNLEWATYLGGTRTERGMGVALADNEDVLITGYTASPTFPTTPGTIESVWQGSTFDYKAFITRMHSSGSSLVWSTLLGGPTYDGGDGTKGFDIAVIPCGDVFVTGSVVEFGFPTTPGAYQTVFHYDPVVSGNTLNADGFLARINPTGSALMFSTLLGTDYSEYGIDVEADESGIATVASFGGVVPTTPGCFQTIPTGGMNFAVSRFDPSGSRLLYSTIVGGPNEDVLEGMAMAPDGRVTLVGYSNGGFPVTPGSFDPTYNGGQYDGVAVTLDLYPTGVAAIGTSTPACHGPLILQTSEMPQAGSGTFSLLCSNAPTLSRGLLLIGRSALAQPVFVGVSALWVDPFSSGTRILPVISDMNGFVEVQLPLTTAPSGTEFVAQVLFRQRPQCMVQGLTCASQALDLDVQ